MLTMRSLSRHCAAVLLFLVLPARPADAQTGSSEADSLRFYELSEIVVGGRPDGGRVAAVGSVRRVPLARIVRTDAPDVAGLARLLPSAHLQTNSRGESLVYLRGSGERQVAVFLDGALLNVPWDNRVDLSAVPASVLGGMQVTQGAGSVLYGTNVLGGVVNLSTRSLDGDGQLSELTAAGGSGGFARLDGMHVRRKGANSVIVAAGLNRQDGFTRGSNADVPFNAGSGNLRLNTDRRMAHAYARVARRWKRVEGGLSLLHVDAAKGVAPEGHLDPAEERVRFWRYPEWSTSMASANLVATPMSAMRVRGTAWINGFSQRIEQFESAGFDEVTEIQDDTDRTVGMRVAVEQALGSSLLRGAVNALASGHRQSQGVPGHMSGTERYRQKTSSLGLEWAGGQRLRWLMGANLDWFAQPETAGKPGAGTFRAWGATGSVERDLAGGTEVRATIGRKVRFPTMRELFGTALNRFVVNEDLRPESAVLADVGVRHVGDRGTLEATAFLNRTWDTIDQTNVTVAGERLRQRVNLDGSRVVGLELLAAGEVTERLEIAAALTLSDPAVLGDPDRKVLVEKPDVLGTVEATFRPGVRQVLSAEAVYTGRAYGLDPRNELVALPRVLQLNLRASTRAYTAAGLFVEVFARADNITDRSLYAQLGLPGPGRTLQAGISLAY